MNPYAYQAPPGYYGGTTGGVDTRYVTLGIALLVFLYYQSGGKGILR